MLWFFLILIYLFYFTVYSRHEYIKRSESLSFREGKIPAVRGSIFDKDGVRLAWSLRCYDLLLKDAPVSSLKTKRLVQKINKIFPDINRITEFCPDKEMVIKRNLTSKELKSVQMLLSTTPKLTIRSRFKRMTINTPEVKKYIGIVNYIDDTCIGVSGIEKNYNSYLSGSDGLYVVMLDKDRKWIKGTSIYKKEMVPGKDLFLKESMNDIGKPIPI